jgi:hypothetical protein
MQTTHSAMSQALCVLNILISTEIPVAYLKITGRAQSEYICVLANSPNAKKHYNEVN